MVKKTTHFHQLYLGFHQSVSRLSFLNKRENLVAFDDVQRMCVE